MKIPSTLFYIALVLPLPAIACPTGMVFDGNGCSPPYEYTGWDWLQDQYDAIDAIGSDRPQTYSPGLTREEAAELERRTLEAQQEKEKELEKLAEGQWYVDSTSTPEGKLCAATFAKYAGAGVEGGVVTIMGFQQPKPDAWLMFQGAELPTPRSVEKLKVTLQQDDEPAQTVQTFSYRSSTGIGEVSFAVPGLMAALEGMSDEQSFELLIDGERAMSIQWTAAAPVIEQLKQCAQ